MQIKTLIVDDEKSNRELLNSLIEKHCTNLKVIGLANSVDTAIEIIQKQHPELVFLDIKMPHKDGFELLESLQTINFEVIIVTAYNQFAIKAIKYCAIDYLLKPINSDELTEAVKNVTERIQQKQENERLKQLVIHLNNKENIKIGLASHDRIDFVEINNIVRCEGDNNYTHVFLENGKKKTVSKILKDFEELLTDHGFIRVHQSHLINTKHILSYLKNDGGNILMKDNMAIPISRTKKNDIVALIKNIHL